VATIGDLHIERVIAEPAWSKAAPNTYSTGAAPTEASTDPNISGAARLIEPLGSGIHLGIYKD